MASDSEEWKERRFQSQKRIAILSFPSLVAHHWDGIGQRMSCLLVTHSLSFPIQRLSMACLEKKHATREPVLQASQRLAYAWRTETGSLGRAQESTINWSKHSWSKRYSCTSWWWSRPSQARAFTRAVWEEDKNGKREGRLLGWDVFTRSDGELVRGPWKWY